MEDAAVLLALVLWVPVALETLRASPPLEVWLRVEGREDAMKKKGINANTTGLRVINATYNERKS